MFQLCCDGTKLFQELFPSSFSLMTDVFGNYVIQKFLEHGSDEQRSQLLLKVIIRSVLKQFFQTSLSQVLPHVESLTVQMYGCRVVQKVLETVGKDEKKLIIQVRILNKDPNFVHDN